MSIRFDIILTEDIAKNDLIQLMKDIKEDPEFIDSSLLKTVLVESIAIAVISSLIADYVKKHRPEAVKKIKKLFQIVKRFVKSPENVKIVMKDKYGKKDITFDTDSESEIMYKLEKGGYFTT